MTTFDPHSTLAYSTVASVVSQSSNTLILNVQPGDGILFSPNQQVILFPVGVQPRIGNIMIARLTGISTDQFTINYSSGNREGTSIQGVQAGFQIANGITPKTFIDIENAINAGIPVHTKALINNAGVDFASIDVLNNTNFSIVFEFSIDGFDGTDLTGATMKSYIVGNNQSGIINSSNNGVANLITLATGILQVPAPILGITSINPTTFSLNPGDLGDAFSEPGAFLNLHFWMTVLTGQTITYL